MRFCTRERLARVSVTLGCRAESKLIAQDRQRLRDALVQEAGPSNLQHARSFAELGKLTDFRIASCFEQWSVAGPSLEQPLLSPLSSLSSPLLLWRGSLRPPLGRSAGLELTGLGPRLSRPWYLFQWLCKSCKFSHVRVSFRSQAV